jgi:hypothetical protein
MAVVDRDGLEATVVRPIVRIAEIRHGVRIRGDGIRKEGIVIAFPVVPAAATLRAGDGQREVVERARGVPRAEQRKRVCGESAPDVAPAAYAPFSLGLPDLLQLTDGEAADDVFFGFTTIARLSNATGSSMKSMARARQARISAVLIGRDAAAISS